MRLYLLWHLAALAGGSILDLIVGDPHGIPHPVVWCGRLIGALTKKLHPEGALENPAREFRRGLVLIMAVILSAVIFAALILTVFYRLHPAAGCAAEAAMTCYILAAKSLYDESMKVCRDLQAGDLVKARRDLSMIVGRDTAALNESAVARAAVETVAENTSDGVIAPLLYTAFGGPVLGFFYKAVNTMDSMVGYKNERFLYFGRAAAKLDDAVNYLPSRISALLLVAAAGIWGAFSKDYSAGRAWRTWRRDRRKHTSPNSAQTESACAGALGLQLGGSSAYQGIVVEKPTIGDPVREVAPDDIRKCSRLMFTAEFLAVTLIMILAGCLIL